MATVPTTLLTDDLNVAFSDWGVTVTYRQVTATYDPPTQQSVETNTDTVITALVSGDDGQPTPGTAGHGTTNSIQLFVRQSDLPAGEPKLTSRVILAGELFNIIGYAGSADGLTYHLQCSKT